MTVAVQRQNPGADASAWRAPRSLNRRILDLFVVDPSSGHALGYIDGMRALAVLGVIAVHSYGAGNAPDQQASGLIGIPFTSWRVDIAPIAFHGGMGVHLFFVLSGFLLAQSWLKASYTRAPRPSTYTYFKLRIFRIVPAYYVCLFLILLFFTPIFIPTALVYSRDGLLIILAHLIFLQYVVPLSSTSFNFDGVMWTLTIEALFYVTLPFIIPLFYRKRWPIGLGAAIAVQVGWLYCCNHYFGGLTHLVQASVAHNAYIAPAFDDFGTSRFLQQQFPGHIAEFCLGVTCSNFAIRARLKLAAGRLIRALTSRVAGVIYFVLGWAIVLLYMYTYPLPDGTDYAPWWHASPAFFSNAAYYFGEFTSGLGFTLVVAGLVFGFAGMRSAFSVTPLRLIGIVSYSIYLWHVPVIFVIARIPTVAAMTPTARFHASFGLDVLLVLPLAAFMYLAVEQPFMRRARSAARAKATGASQASPTPAFAPVRFPRLQDIVEAPTEARLPVIGAPRLAPDADLDGTRVRRPMPVASPVAPGETGNVTEASE